MVTAARRRKPATNNISHDETNVAIISTETKSDEHGNAPKIDRIQSERSRDPEPRIPAAAALCRAAMFTTNAPKERKDEQLQGFVEYGSDVRHGVREHRRVRDVQ
jgi:hypothetical protein